MHKIMVALLLSAMAFPGYVLASGDHGQGGHDRHGKGHHGHHKKGGKLRHLQNMLKKLDLSKEQKASLKVVFKNTRVEMKKLREQMRDKRKAMYALMHAEPEKESTAITLARELGELKTAKMVLYVKTHFQVGAQLSEAQREKMRQMHNRHRKH